MKKGLILIIAGAAVTVATVALVVTSVISAPSKYEGKIVKDIEFVGVKKLGISKEEIVPLRVLKGMSILKDEFTTNAQFASNPEYDPLYLNQPFTQTKVRDTIKLLFAKGNLYNVRIEAQEYGGGVRVKIFCEERPMVSQVVFKGLDKVQESDLKEKVFVKAGSPFRQDLLDRSLPEIKKKYFDSGLGNCVLSYKVEPDKSKDDGSVIVTIIVDEGEELRVAKITILGAKKIPAYELQAFMDTKEKGLLNEGMFKQEEFKTDKEKILMYYKQNGYLDADFADEQDQVSFEWGDPENKETRTRSIYLTLKIVEGERYYFDGYHLTGVTGTVGHKDKGTDITKEKIEKMYELRPQKESSPVDFAAAALGIDDDTDVICDNTLFEKDRHAISFLYASEGHVFARVTPSKKVEEREKVVNGKKVKRKYVTYDLDVYEGAEAHIEKIFIRGCKKTKEYVVRREVLMKEDVNELFDSYKVQRTRENIYNLGFFKEVNIEMRPGSTSEKLNILINVEEQPTGSISLGGGYGTSTGFSIFTDLGDKNFMGRGEAVNLRLEYGPQKISGTLSYTMPWIFNLPVSFETAVYYSLTTVTTTTLFANYTGSTDTSNYKVSTIGYYMGPTYRFWHYYSIGVIWDDSWSSYLDPTGNCPDEVFTTQELGMQEKRKLKLRFARNTLDNVFYPTRGINSSITVSFVGGTILGGNSHWIRYDPGVEMFYTPFHLPFLPKYPCVFEFRANGSFITAPLDISKVESMQDRFDDPWLKLEDRLTIGGPPGYGTSAVLRGWEPNSSPLPVSWQNGLFDTITYGSEFRVPIHPQYLWFVLFFDAGSMWTDRFWEDNMTDEEKYAIAEDKSTGAVADIRDIGNVNLLRYFRYSYGFGFKIQIPMMPLRFWFAQKALWNGQQNAPFKPIGGLTFQFSIGDIQF